MPTAPVFTTDTYSSKAGRRGLRGLVVFLLLVVLLVAAVVVADIATRQHVEGVVADKVRSALSLPKKTPVAVQVGGFSVLQQLAQGRIDSIDIETPSVSVGGITGSLSGRAIGVPLDEKRSVQHLTIDFGVAEDQLVKLAGNVAGVPVTKISLAPPDLSVLADVTVLGAAIPVTVAVTPTVSDGQLAFTPKSASVFGATLSAQDLRDRFGAVARTALETRDFCIATSLPKAFAVNTLSVKTHEIVLGLAATDVPLSDSSLQIRGTCPAG